MPCKHTTNAQYRRRVPTLSGIWRAWGERGLNGSVTLIAAVLSTLALIAYRATLAYGFGDDAYYIIVPWRLSQGARYLVDEISLQATGSLPVVPALSAWAHIFGDFGIVLFARLLYIPLAIVLWYVVFVMLRRSFSTPIAALAPVPLLLSPPLSHVAVTYNTLPLAMFTAAVVVGFAAWRDERPIIAAVAGAIASAAACVYPPMVVAAVFALGAFGLVTRKRSLLVAWIGGATAVATLFVGLVLSSLTAQELQVVMGQGGRYAGAVGMDLIAGFMDLATLAHPLIWPLWLLAIVASLPRVGWRVRRIALAAIPFAAGIKGAVRLLEGRTESFGTYPAAWAILVTIALLAPVYLELGRRGRTDLQGLMRLAIPFSAAGVIIIFIASNTGFFQGVLMVALAPLFLIEWAGWLLLMVETLGEPRTWLLNGAAIMLVLGLLFSLLYDPKLPMEQKRVETGPCAGLRLDVDATARIAEIEADSSITSAETVLFIGPPGGYLFSGARVLSNVSWFGPSSASGVTLDYYRRVGDYPDMVFIQRESLNGSPIDCPLTGYVLDEYRLVEDTGRYALFVEP